MFVCSELLHELLMSLPVVTQQDWVNYGMGMVTKNGIKYYLG